MRSTTLLSLAVTAALIPASAALAQTAAGYAIQTGQTVSSGVQFPTIQPPSNLGDNHPHSFSIPATATDNAHRGRRHHRVLDDSNRPDDDDSSPSDNWVEVK